MLGARGCLPLATVKSPGCQSTDTNRSFEANSWEGPLQKNVVYDVKEKARLWLRGLLPQRIMGIDNLLKMICYRRCCQ